MSLAPEISQRDLRLRSKDIMDAVERGESFTVTRDGRPMGQLIPLRRQFVSREQLTMSWAGAGSPDWDRFRADLDAIIDPYQDDPYER